MNRWQEIEDQLARAQTLDDLAQPLATLMAGGYTVGRDGRLRRAHRRAAGTGDLRIVMRPQVLPTPHVRVVGAALDAALSITDGTLLDGTLGERERKLIGWWWAKNQPALIVAWELAQTVNDSLRNLHSALYALPSTPADETLREQLLASAAVSDIPSFLAAARGESATVTPGLWATCIALVIAHWQRRGEAGFVVEALPVLLQHFPVRPDPQAAALVALIVGALDLLHWEVSGAPDDDRDAVARAFHGLADHLQQLGRSELAAHLAIDGGYLGQRGSAAAEACARAAVEFARALGKAALTAAGLVLLAETLAAASVADSSRRLEAFDAAECAIEAMAGIDATLRCGMASMLAHRLPGDAAFEPLRLIASGFCGVASAGHLGWQDRVQRTDPDEWIASIESLYRAGSVWFALDDARASLQQAPADHSALADWTHWTVDHPAYRRVIPHHRSFLRERDFDLNLLVLTHELTHVLSFLGGVGMALACLRAATLAAELALWRAHEPSAAETEPPHEPLRRMAMHGFAPLPPGRAAALPGIEQTLGLHRKAKSLQDIWAPWFEGLAVFGETSADPMHDDAVVDPVNGALRYLVDTAALIDPGSAGSRAAFDAAMLAAIDEFQQRSAAAVQRHGAERLMRLMRERDSLYWIGYLAVRVVVARWRRTTGRRISGTQAFRLLLHATRFDTAEAIPSLGLGEQAFAGLAEDAMLAWVRRLADLSAGEIEVLIRSHEADPRTKKITWVQGRPALVDESPDAASDVAERLRARVAQALTGAATPGGPVGEAGWGLSMDELARLANQTILLGSFLPIGRTEALFHLGIDPDDGNGHLMLLLRTTEAHVDGGSSMNLFGLTLAPESATELAEQVTRSGRSRIEVTRVIDMGGLASRDLGVAGFHLLALRYANWFDIQGATNSVEAVLRSRPERAKELREMLRSRLYPAALVQVERTLIAVPEFAAVRAIEWIRDSVSWDATARDVDAVAAAARVEALAARILLHGSSSSHRSWPLARLAQTMFGDGALAQRLAAMDFETLTQEAPEHRDTIAKALFQTAHGHGEASLIADAVLALRTCGCNILSHQAHGWDVVAG